MMIILGILCVVFLGSSIWLLIQQKKLRQKLKDVEQVEKIGEDFNNQIKLNLLVERIVLAIKRETDAEIGAIFLVNEEMQQLDLKVAIGINGQNLESRYSKIGIAIADWVAHHGDVINIKDVRENTQIHSWCQQDMCRIKYEEAILTMPIKEENKLVGVLQLINHVERQSFEQHVIDKIKWIIDKKIVMSLQKARLYEQLRTTFLDSIRTVASVIDAKDKYTIGHCQRVAEYALRLGRYMGLEDEDLEDLEYAAILHDVGKIGISDVILNKTTGLTDEEYEIIKQHPMLGAEILKQITTLKDEIVWGAKYHHERYDGQGYCEGLKGKEIPLYARIIAIADAYDAMVGNRVYRKGISVQEAVSRLEEGKGKQFDPGLTNLFIQMIRATERSKKNGQSGGKQKEERRSII